MPKFVYKTYSYSQRTPQAKMQRLVTGILPYPPPTPPTPPPTPLTISGTISRDGTVSSGIPVEFTSIGTVTTNSSGVYTQAAAYTGYTGNGIPHYSSGSFTPASRSYSSLAVDATAQDYALYLPTGTDSLTLFRDGSFELNFTITSTTGYFAVQDDVGNITIHANGNATFDFAVTFCTAWPCFSATDAFNTGSITSLTKDGVQGFAGTVDLTGVPNIVQLVASEGSVNDLLVAGCTQLTDISVFNNLLGLGEVNAVLVALDTNGALNGQIFITGNAAPTGAGLTAKSNLEGKGWLVNTD